MKQKLVKYFEGYLTVHPEFHDLVFLNHSALILDIY